jgi:hypothetical protein
MTPAEFKRKWARYSGKETAAYQEHFNDLCALLGQPSPAAADPTGSESFCFQKRVVKDAELFALEDSGRVAEEPDADRERGFADVWKRGFFAWEYKGKKKNLDAAYQQLLRYRESLLKISNAPQMRNRQPRNSSGFLAPRQRKNLCEPTDELALLTHPGY